MDKKLASIIKYFAVFDYFPSFKDIYTFFPEKISKKKLRIIFKAKKYTVGEYGIGRKISNIKYQISKRKLDNWRYKIYIKLLSFPPQIKLVGLSGSISMMNAKEDDDIDLFIITGENRLFTGRLIALVLAQILGLRRGRDSATNKKARYQKFFDGKPQTAKNLVSSLSKNKVCLNLFFDESNLKVPKFKQTEFVGHEVLQMKPIIVKNNIYDRFLEANGWVFKLFPNSKERISNFKFLISNQFQISNFKNLNDWIEHRLKNFQLKLINRHRTTEIITSTQLWFHPDDFEKKINADKKRIDTDS